MPARIARACRYAPLLIITPLLLTGCNRTGDFGRAEVSPAEEVVQSLFPAPAPTGIVSEYPLTDDERELRALAVNLMAGPREWHGHSAPVGLAADYAGRLVHGPDRSSAARYAQLIDDTRNDIIRLEPFFALARRVADLDSKRERSLAYIPALKPEAVRDARLRVRENSRLVGDVHRAVAERAGMYRYALERLVVALPSPMAVEAERTRMELERRIAAMAIIAGLDVAYAAPPDGIPPGATPMIVKP